MENRARRRLATAIVAGTVLALGAIAGVVIASRGESDAASYRGSPPPPGIVLPSFELSDYTGEIVRSPALKGNPVLVTFLETKCKEACPVIASQIGKGLDLLDPAERRSVVAIAISVHPGDDTSASVRRFLRKHQVDGDLRYLIGSERELRPVWDAFQILPALDTGDADTHSASVRIFNRDGEWVSTLHAGVDLTPENLAHDLVAAQS
jgi:protein SCO1/2